MTEVNVEQMTEWIETNLVPKITKLFGTTSDKIRYDISVPKNSFFLSSVCFMDLFIENDDKNEKNESESKLSLVIKKPLFDEKLNEKMNIMMQFHNEILFYTKVAKGNSRFPTCVFTAEDMPENTVIITENILPQGYEMCAETYDIPVEYVFAGVEEIARFHAMSYTMKELQPEEFKQVVDDIQEARYIPGGWIHEFIDIVASRPVAWLRKNNIDPNFCEKIEKYFGNAFNNITLGAVNPVEPLATLCHGDFTRNNIFFKRVDGKLKAMLIDFAVIGYSSPITDLSAFLFLNCSSAERTSKFNEIFKTYHDTLIDQLSDAGVKDLKKYSYDNMFAEYKRAAAYGYIIALYFLPVVRNPSLIDTSIVRDNHKDGAKQTLAMGGEEMDELYGKMILELRDIGCFDHLS